VLPDAPPAEPLALSAEAGAFEPQVAAAEFEPRDVPQVEPPEWDVPQVEPLGRDVPQVEPLERAVLFSALEPVVLFWPPDVPPVDPLAVAVFSRPAVPGCPAAWQAAHRGRRDSLLASAFLPLVRSPGAAFVLLARRPGVALEPYTL
jgi:hypothetical protein